MHVLITSIIDLEKTSYSRLHHFIDHLLKKGHRVSVISIRDTWKHKGLKQNQELASKIDIHYVTDKNLGVLMQKGKAFLLTRMLLQGINLSSVDIHLAYNSLIISNRIANALKKRGICTVYDLADDIPEMVATNPQIPKVLWPVAGIYSRRMLEKNLKLSSHVTISAKEFLTNMGIKRYAHTYIPNGVNLEMFKPARDGRKVKDRQDIVVGYLGALREWVDLRPMLLGIKASEDHKIKVLVVGGEEDLPRYKGFVSENKMGDIVTFTGNVPYKEVPSYIHQMDICTMPFRKNRVTDGTCPLKLLEYLACEKPAICSRLNETRTILGDMVLYADTPEEWKKQIQRLAEDPGLRQKMGKEARAYIQKNFEWKRLCQKMEDVLKKYSREKSG